MRTTVTQAGLLVLALTVLGTTEGAAQAPGSTGPATQTQPQRDQTPINLDIIEKPKPEIEIYTGPEDPSQQVLKGIVVVPEEASKAPPPPAGEQSAPPEKKRD